MEFVKTILSFKITEFVKIYIAELCLEFKKFKLRISGLKCLQLFYAYSPNYSLQLLKVVVTCVVYVVGCNPNLDTQLIQPSSEFF